MSGHNFRWTDDLDAIMREMAPDHSASQIASVIGTTRCAVIGRCRRRKIDLRSAATKVVRAAVLRLPLKPRKARVARSPVAVAPAPEPIVAIDWTPRMIGLDSLRRGSCRWPLWQAGAPPDQKFYCGNDALPGKPYCAHCFALGTSPRTTVSLDRKLGIDKAGAAA